MNNLQTTPEGNIVVHRPLFNPTGVEQHYSRKDGVAIKYVCTTELVGDYPIDIFYRETPHPQFKNYYFGLYQHQNSHITITNADMVETLEFDSLEDEAGHWHYSRSRHDYHAVGGSAIDGGRAYTRIVGGVAKPMKKFKVRDGEFYCD